MGVWVVWCGVVWVGCLVGVAGGLFRWVFGSGGVGVEVLVLVLWW